MPTAPKIMAALILAITGFSVAQIIFEDLPDGQPTKLLFPTCIGIPAICGWRVMGRLVGRGYSNALNAGFYAMVVSVFYVILAFSIELMIKKSKRMQYDGPMEAVVGMFDNMLDYSMNLLNPFAIVTLVLGGFICGWAAEWAHRRYE